MSSPFENRLASFTLLIDNEVTRVTRWEFGEKGDNTGWHCHKHDYVVVPLFDGILDIVGPNNERSQVQLKNGIPYFREAGVEHDVLNGNDFPCSFIEIEYVAS